MGILSRIFGPPDIDSLTKNGDLAGLILLLTYPKENVQEQAAAALAEMKNQEQVATLIKAALTNPRVRAPVIKILKVSSPTLAARILAQVCELQMGLYHLAVMKSLKGAVRHGGASYDKSMKNALSGLSGDPSKIMQTCLSILSDLGIASIGPLIDLLPADHGLYEQVPPSVPSEWVKEAFVRLGPTSVEPLAHALSQLKYNQTTKKIYLTCVLQSLQDKRALQTLKDTLQAEQKREPGSDTLRNTLEEAIKTLEGL